MYKRLARIPTQIWILVLVVIFGTIASILFFTRDRLETPAEHVVVSDVDVVRVIEGAGRHIQLPDDEPVVVEIKDIDLLLTQSQFYRGAQNGDYLLLYGEVQRAYIYSMDRDVLIAAGPIQFDLSGSTKEANSRAITIEIRNGTGISGEASKLGRTLSSDILFAVIKVDDAAHTNYADSILVNRTGAGISAQVQALSEKLGIPVVASLPLDEANSVADVVVIIGKK